MVLTVVQLLYCFSDIRLPFQDVFDLPFHMARDKIEESLRTKMASIKVVPFPLLHVHLVDPLFDVLLMCFVVYSLNI